MLLDLVGQAHAPNLRKKARACLRLEVQDTTSSFVLFINEKKINDTSFIQVFLKRYNDIIFF
jgi:hypothetical protein